LLISFGESGGRGIGSIEDIGTRIGVSLDWGETKIRIELVLQETGIMGHGRNGCLAAVHTCNQLRIWLANRVTCAGPDLPLQERYQAGTLEVSIPFRDHETIREHDSLHPSLISRCKRTCP